MKRTMKQVMMDKLATHYLAKRGLSVAEAKEVSQEEMFAQGFPQVLRSHIANMDDSTNKFSVSREIATLGTASTKTNAPIVPYTPELEKVVEQKVIEEVVQTYVEETPVEVQPEVVPVAAVEHVEEVHPTPYYTEGELRTIVESVDPSTNPNTIMKRAKAVMEKDHDYDADTLTALCKEQSTAAKK